MNLFVTCVFKIFSFITISVDDDYKARFTFISSPKLPGGPSLGCSLMRMFAINHFVDEHNVCGPRVAMVTT